VQLRAVIRLVLFFCAMVVAARAAPDSVPDDLAAALASFRPDPPRGWSYTQTTATEANMRTEQYDATRPDFDRWTLVHQDGRPPTDEEARRYREIRSRRTHPGSAPRITEQLDLSTLEVVDRNAQQATYRCRVRPGEATDRTAAFLRATIVVHLPTRTIEAIELASTGAFRPTLGVTIAEMKTRMTYRPPEGDEPMLPREVVTRVRGTAFWFKSLDADRVVTFSKFQPPLRRNASRPTGGSAATADPDAL
jgi:hypothetical protein